MSEPTRRGLSKEAWAAVGVIGAAVVTGVVALLTHIITPAQPASTQPAGAPFTSSTAAGTTGAPLDAMVGKWEGTAEDSNGLTFQVTLEVEENCVAGQLCGSIGVPHVPCYGQIFLANTDGDEVEFRVANFDERSDREVCQPGAGERFRPLPDGRLAYRTTYEPIAQGILNRE